MKRISIQVSESLGAVSGELIDLPGMTHLFVFAHGAGAGMQHPFMTALSDALAKAGIGTLRFNFPYMERKGKRPDPPAIAEKTVVKAIEMARSLHPAAGILAGGKSFGGRMTSQALAKSPSLPVSGLVFVGFPLHATGKPGVERAAHLRDVDKPMLFLQGTRDALARIDLIQSVCGALPNAVLHPFEDADHSFKSGKRNLIPDLADTIKTWSASLIPNGNSAADNSRSGREAKK